MRHLVEKLRQKAGPWRYLLLGFFLFAQSFAASHEASHIDTDIQDHICILCQSSDNNPADTAHPQSISLASTISKPFAPEDTAPLAGNIPDIQKARGPPTA